nr:hypothetical protein [Ktedonosporobacter rubrisoli]
MRRYLINASKVIKLGELSTNRKTYEVTLGAEQLRLPLKEFQLLFQLASYLGKIFGAMTFKATRGRWMFMLSACVSALPSVKFLLK